jgi:hypothetical protein
VQRIFLGLAAIALVLLALNVIVGLTGGDYNQAAHDFYRSGERLKELSQSNASSAEIEEAKKAHDELLLEAKRLQPHMTRHMLLGIGSALITLLVCSVSITYFVGTSRWFKEVVETYRLNPDYVQQSARIKRRSFRWSVAGALAIVAVVGLGAASEPTWANAALSADYVLPHYLAALAAIAFLLVSFYMQALSLSENGKLIEAVMADVRRIRAERGLQVEESPPEQTAAV